MPAKRRLVRVLLPVALLVALVASTLATPAVAATYQTSVSPNPFSYPEQLVYRLHMRTGGQPERLLVSASGGGGFMRLEGMRLEGPGSVVNSGEGSGVYDRFCRPLLPDSHGSSFVSSPWVEVEIPADSSSAIALLASPNRLMAPWRGMDLSAAFSVVQGSQPAEIVRSPSPVNSGRHGVEISFRSDPEGVPGGCPRTFTPVRFGRSILVSGRADTAAAGQLMTIRAVRSAPARRSVPPSRVPQGRGRFNLASVRIAEDGAFAYRWRPTVPGAAYSARRLHARRALPISVANAG